MKGFSTRFKLIFFITLFIFFFLTLTIVLGKIREGVTSLKYQVTYFFEKSLKTKVKIEKIEGDFVNELILKNMVIYHQFRDNVKFINVKTVRIKFDLVKAILKEKILIRNISTISIEDFTLYLDEYFTNLEAVKVIGGVDDGIDDGPKDIKVLLVKGNIQSNFVNLKNGKFRVSNLNGYFKKLITVNYFEGSGYFEGNKVYMNTKTPFKLAGNDSIKKGVMTGILDIKNLNFLGYTFKGLALDYSISNERLKFKIKPTSYIPFEKSLPKEYIDSYRSRKPYNYLINLSFDYLMDENDIYIDVNADQESEAIKTIIKNYLLKEGLGFYFKNIYDWDIKGKANFRFKKGKMFNFSIKLDEARNVFQLNDQLSFCVEKQSLNNLNSKSTLIFKDINYYNTKGGTIKGTTIINSDKTIENIDLDINKILIPSFFPNKPAKMWNLAKNNNKIDLNNSSKIDNTFYNIDLNKSPITSKIKIKKTKNHNVFSLKDNKLASLSLPNIKGKFFFEGSKLHSEIYSNEQIEYKIKSIIDIEKPDNIVFKLALKKLKYSIINKIFDLKTNLGNIFFTSSLKGNINLKNLKKSIIKGHVKVFNSGLTEIDLPKEKVLFNVIFKNGNFYFDNSYIHDINAKFKGSISFYNGIILPELEINYLNIPIYLDGEIKKIKNKYQTKINLVYDNFKRQWTSFTGILRPDDNLIRFEDSQIRHNQNDYKINGHFGFTNNKIFTDIYLNPIKTNDNINTYTAQSAKYRLKGDVLISHSNNQTYINPNFYIKLNETPINLWGNIVLANNKILPNLSILWKNPNQIENQFNLKGEILKNPSKYDANLNLEYNNNKYDVLASISYDKTAYNYSISLKWLEKLLILEGKVIPKNKNTIYTNTNIIWQNPSNRIINIDGFISKRGNIISTNLTLLSDSKKVKIDGYVAYIDKYYFPYFRAIYTTDNAINYPFIFEGKLTDQNDYIDIDTVINKQLNITGQFNKYSALSLKLFFDNFKVTTIDQKSFTVANKFNEDGIIVQINDKGITTNGNIGLKDFSFLPNTGFEVSTQFSYDIPFNYDFDKKLREITFKSIILSKDNKTIMSSSGGLSYVQNNLILELFDKKMQSNVKIKYNPKNNIISSNFNFNDFNLKNLSKNLKGQLTGHLDIRGNVSNPKLMSSGMKITNGKYENINFNADFSFKKSDKELIVPHGNISFGDSTIQVKNLKYYLPKIQTSLSDYFNDLKPNGTISAENFIFFYKKSKIELYNLNYFIGNKSIPILKDISHNNLNANNNILFDVYQILQNPNSKFTFQKGLITLGKNYFLIESFLFAPGDNWRLDCDIKVKSNFLKNFYLAQFSLFGGRKNNEHAELNIKANNLQINDQKHNDIEFIFEAVGNKWKLWPNRLGINLDLILTKNLLDYILTFKGQSTKLISTGKVDFDNENIDIDIKLVNDDLSISKITSLLLNKAKGKLYTDVKLFGKWNNPQLTGIFKFEKGEIQLIDQESIENINIILQFNQGKPDKNHFIHSINASANYNEGIANIIGSFNFSNWNFTNYEFKFITPKKMLLDLKNNIFEYKGYIKSDLYLVGTQKENRLSGTIRLSEGKAVYVGRKKIKEVSKNFFTTLNFDVVEIIVENDVKANIGPDRISLGEVILKEYNPKTNEGTRLKLKKRLTDVKSDNFLLEGEIETKKGEFDYLGHTFKIINSKIIFKPNQNPKIEINSRTKVRDEDNRLVTIYLKLNNELNSLLEESSTTPEKENILLKSLSSSPTKSPQEIILLLGITEGTGEKERDPYNQSYSNISASKTADVALNLTLIKPIERKLKEIFGIDTFNIRQKFLRNTLFRKSQSYTSNTGSIPTDRSELNPLSDTEITVGKYLTDDIYFSTGLLLLQNLDRSGETKKIWKFGLEADLLPLFNIESERVKLQLGIEYHRKPDEILPANRNEGIINFELNIEF